MFASLLVFERAFGTSAAFYFGSQELSTISVLEKMASDALFAGRHLGRSFASAARSGKSCGEIERRPSDPSAREFCNEKAPIDQSSSSAA